MLRVLPRAVAAWFRALPKWSAAERESDAPINAHAQYHGAELDEIPDRNAPRSPAYATPYLLGSLTVSILRPFFRRRLSTSRPHFVAIRVLNPCVRIRRLLRGLYVGLPIYASPLSSISCITLPRNATPLVIGSQQLTLFRALVEITLTFVTSLRTFAPSVLSTTQCTLQKPPISGSD